MIVAARRLCRTDIITIIHTKDALYINWGHYFYVLYHGDGAAMHFTYSDPGHAKVQLFLGQKQYLRPRVWARPQESNPQPPALQSSAQSIDYATVLSVTIKTRENTIANA